MSLAIVGAVCAGIQLIVAAVAANALQRYMSFYYAVSVVSFIP